MIFSKVCVTMALNLRIKYIIFTGVYLNQVRVVILIQVLNSFVSGIYAVALPLMMEERNIDIVTIGFLFASMPIVFQVLRMAVATVSDFWGRKFFFVLNGFLGVVYLYIKFGY